MSILKYAITGTHGTGKSYIVKKVSVALRLRGYDVVTLDSPTRRVKAMGFKNNEDGEWTQQLLSGVLRYTGQKEKLLISPQPEVILSDRCLLDELAYDHAQMYHGSLKDENFSLTMEGQFLSYTHDILTEFAKDDFKNYFDTVFLKRVHPDHLPVEDGDRSGSLEFQTMIANYVDAEARALSPYKLPELPLDRDKAVSVLVEFIAEAVDRQREGLISSK